jgi:allophanate hydrolase subunit 1
MKPNQSHVAGLELALDATGPFTSAAGARQKMRDILERAKSDPAEVAQGDAEIPDIAATFDGLYLVPIMSLECGDDLMTVAQHNRIVAALTTASKEPRHD